MAAFVDPGVRGTVTATRFGEPRPKMQPRRKAGQNHAPGFVGSGGLFESAEDLNPARGGTCGIFHWPSPALRILYPDARSDSVFSTSSGIDSGFRPALGYSAGQSRAGMAT